MAIGPWKYGRAGGFRLLVYLECSAHKGPIDSTSSGKVDIRLEALANARMSYINKDPGRITCLIWGDQSVLRLVTPLTAEEKPPTSLNSIGIIIGTDK
jgi:hypothetical protein